MALQNNKSSLYSEILEIIKNKIEAQNEVQVYHNPVEGELAKQVQDSKNHLFPDLFAVANGQIKAVCAVETPQTLEQKPIKKWERYASCGVNFLLIVPEEKKPFVKSLLSKYGIDCKRIIVYEQN